mgnify:CR=1 FL=1
MNIYIVTDGSYSDYHVVAAYDEEHKEVAKLHAQNLSDGDVLEITLNEDVERVKDGRLPYNVLYFPDSDHWITHVFPKEWNDNVTGNDAWFSVYVYARDTQHAQKAAMEKITRHKAMSIE